MKFQEIITLDREPNNGEAYMGGGCKLAEEIPWPIDSAGHPCMHLMTVPCNFFEKEKTARFISVFIPYFDKLYYKEIRYLESNKTTIIIHQNKSPERNEYIDNSVQSIPRALIVINQDEEDSSDICGSKIFNIPGWLQGEELIENHTCKFSMYGNDFSAAFKEERGLFSDGVIFIELLNDYQTMKEGSQVGKLIWQL